MNNTKNLYVSIFGAPNAGKSTLINNLVGFTVSAVSKKAQTTREAVRGILTEGDTQIVFIDTPGVFEANKESDNKLILQARKGMRQGNFHILAIDSSKKYLPHAALNFLSMYESSQEPITVVLTKVDKSKESSLLMAQSLAQYTCIKDIFFVSAHENKGTEAFKNHLLQAAKEGYWEYDSEMVTDRNITYLTEELTREQVFRLTRDEIPYIAEVETESLEENDTFLLVKQAIVVQKDCQKKIIIGQGGGLIKQIAVKAKEAIADIVGKQVSLQIFVKTRDNAPVSN